MADKVGFFDEAFEQGKQIVKQAGKQVAGLPGSTVKTAVSQVAPNLLSQSDSQDDLENSPDNKKNSQQKPINVVKNTSTILKGQFIKPKPEQILQEQTELLKVRQELHQNYYQDLVSRPKPNEERASEKVEREEKEEDQKEFMIQQKKQQDDAALANTRRGTGEKITGIGG
jgi:hypothetical protein